MIMELLNLMGELINYKTMRVPEKQVNKAMFVKDSIGKQLYQFYNIL